MLLQGGEYSCSCDADWSGDSCQLRVETDCQDGIDNDQGEEVDDQGGADDYQGEES